MKKVLSILLVLILCVGLFACGNKTDSTGSSAPPADSGSAAQPAGGGDTPAPQPAGGGDTPAAQPSGGGDAAPAQPSGGGDTPAAHVPQGYLTDDVDHHARRTYEIAFLPDDFQFLQQNWFAGLQAFEERLNVKMTVLSADSSFEQMLANIEMLTTRGYDGAIITAQYEIQERVTELLNEAGIPWICFINMLTDADGHTVAPTVVLDQYTAGEATMRWLIDNYKEYWGDIDTSKIGCMGITMSISLDIFSRTSGQRDLFEATFPGNQFLILDTVSLGASGTAFMSAESAYDLVTAAVAANPDVEYWFVVGGGEQFGPGAARAMEAFGRTLSNTLICTVHSGANITDWQSKPPDVECMNIASVYISDMLYGAPALSGVIALIEGRETKDTLWIDETPKDYKYGNNFGVWLIESRIVTRWDYQEYIDEINDMIFG